MAMSKRYIDVEGIGHMRSVYNDHHDGNLTSRAVVRASIGDDGIRAAVLEAHRRLAEKRSAEAERREQKKAIKDFYRRGGRCWRTRLFPHRWFHI